MIQRTSQLIVLLLGFFLSLPQSHAADSSSKNPEASKPEISAEGVIDSLKEKAEKGDTEAQFKIGHHYFNGTGVEKDRDYAFRWFQVAAEKNHSAAQYYLGSSYNSGFGVKRDFAEALKWYRKAANSNLAAAQYILGSCYDRGEGVKKDHAEAATWYRKAAEQGHAIAQNSLGLLYARGWGVKKDGNEAEKWCRKSAEQGFSAGQFNLACFYRGGIGVKRDNVEAYAWFILSHRDPREGTPDLNHLQRFMPVQQVTEGKNRAKELQAQIDARPKGPSEQLLLDYARLLSL